ncbi:MAG TPA: undecaprenyldiphospho-muramoylpentapeptide beta-N-acetylglucosaminyltransferase [Gemmatimonadota bacterium]|nr:undecaprenyldiphospho-muramoylpentapeptide beta-N-acetylglucosaminyltransferase [Gemmatimonadota bacterium]
MGRDAADGIRVVIAGGGTGGHLTPALELGRELARRGADVLLVGGTRGPDRAFLAGSGLPHRFLATPAVERGRWWRNALLPWRLTRAVAAARRILRDHQPQVAVGTGGYVSVPIVLAARVAGIPILLQEQNSVPGMATRFLARFARRVCVQYEEVAERLGGSGKVEVTGSPIAPPEPAEADFAERLDAGRLTVGVFGASQGARGINDAVLGLLAGDPDAAGYNLVWQTGAADHARIEAAAAWPRRFVVRPFFAPMGAVYPRLDLIVCRGGAMTLAEVTAWGIPAIVVPYPHATADHQTANARALESAGAAIVVLERDLAARRLGHLIDGLLADSGRRASMARAARGLGRPRAAADVADRVIEIAEAA